jgi:hypothetical protein
MGEIIMHATKRNKDILKLHLKGFKTSHIREAIAEKYGKRLSMRRLRELIRDMKKAL